MSLWNHLFDSEWRQRSDIESLKSVSMRQSSKLRRQSRKSEERLRDLELEVGELSMICRGLLTLLERQGTVEPAALKAVMHEIDAEDGVIDGRVTPESAQPKAAPKRRKRRL